MKAEVFFCKELL